MSKITKDTLIVKDVAAYKASLKKYLVALPSFVGDKGFNHRTILAEGTSEADAKANAKRLSSASHIGDVKQVSC